MSEIMLYVILSLLSLSLAGLNFAVKYVTQEVLGRLDQIVRRLDDINREVADANRAQRKAGGRVGR